MGDWLYPIFDSAKQHWVMRARFSPLEVIELALHAPQLRADVGRYLVAAVRAGHPA
jgi:hypothetical protein